MPRLTESNPKYRKHKASGQAIVTIDGKDHYLGPWNTRVSRSEYDRLVSEWLANGRHSSRSKFDLTVAELVERFWDYANGYYRHPDGTPTGEASCFKKPLDILATAYGATLASEFGPLAIEVIRNTMIREGWCRNYINAQVARLKLVFKWGVSKELVPSSVHQALATVRNWASRAIVAANNHSGEAGVVRIVLNGIPVGVIYIPAKWSTVSGFTVGDYWR